MTKWFSGVRNYCVNNAQDCHRQSVSPARHGDSHSGKKLYFEGAYREGWCCGALDQHLGQDMRDGGCRSSKDNQGNQEANGRAKPMTNRPEQGYKALQSHYYSSSFSGRFSHSICLAGNDILIIDIHTKVLHISCCQAEERQKSLTRRQPVLIHALFAYLLACRP